MLLSFLKMPRFVGLASLVLAFHTANAKMILQQELKGTDVAPSDDSWGSAVAIDGNIAVVGADSDDVNRTALEPGAVFVFEKDAASGEWKELQQIFASLAEDQDAFGASVALEGNLLVVGAPGSDEGGLSDSGSAYIYVRTGTNPGDKFEEVQQLVAPDGGTASGSFGAAVGVSGSTIIIGEPKLHYSNIHGGAAHIYERDGDLWGLMQSLSVPTEHASTTVADAFGVSVAIDSKTAVVGAPGLNLVFAYALSDALEWELDATLESTETDPDEFGNKLDVDGDLLVVNTYNYGDNLHVFKRHPSNNSWTFDAVLVAGLFGVAVSDGVIAGYGVYITYNDTWHEIDGLSYANVVGVSGNQVIASEAGSRVLIYTIPDELWFETQQLVADEELTSDNFGDKLDIDKTNDNMVVCDGEGWSAGSVGRAYLYQRMDGVDWSNIQVLTDGPADSYHEYCLDAAIDGEFLVVAAVDAAYIYQLGTDGSWVSFQAVQLPVGVGDDCFSCDFAFVELDGNTIVIGEPAADSGKGAAYVFEFDGTEWSFAETLVAPDGADSDGFGELGAIDDAAGSILITASGHDGNGDQAGAVYAFARAADGSWEMEQKITLSEASPGAEFGNDMAYGGGVAVVGGGISLDQLFIVTKGSSGTWNVDQVVEADGVVAVSGDGSRIATPSASFIKASNGTWVEDLSFNNYGGTEIALSASGDAIAIAEYDDVVYVHSLVDILGADTPEEEESGVGLGASKSGIFDP